MSVLARAREVRVSFYTHSYCNVFSEKSWDSYKIQVARQRQTTSSKKMDPQQQQADPILGMIHKVWVRMNSIRSSLWTVIHVTRQHRSLLRR